VLFQPCRSSSLLVTFKMSCYVSMNEIKWWWWWWYLKKEAAICRCFPGSQGSESMPCQPTSSAD